MRCRTTNHFSSLMAIRSRSEAVLPILLGSTHLDNPLLTWCVSKVSGVCTYMHKPIKYVEKAATYAAGAAWNVFNKLNQIGQNPGFIPAWSDKPLLKSWEKTK